MRIFRKRIHLLYGLNNSLYKRFIGGEERKF